MSRQSIQASAYKKVVNAINSYGYLVPIYRDIYEENELGCKILVEQKSHIDNIQCIIDNSSSSRSKSIVDTGRGVVKGASYATLYTPYIAELPLQENDFILYENCFYKVIEITDVVHYNILYQVSLERIDVDGE